MLYHMSVWVKDVRKNRTRSWGLRMLEIAEIP